MTNCCPKKQEIIISDFCYWSESEIVLKDEFVKLSQESKKKILNYQTQVNKCYEND
jgi:hypothetical protein